MTQKTTTYTGRIAFKADTEMSTGYRGRGLHPLKKTFPAGTSATYTRNHYHGDYIAHDGEPVESICHTVMISDKSGTYSATRWELGPDAPNPNWIPNPAERRAKMREAIDSDIGPNGFSPSEVTLT